MKRLIVGISGASGLPLAISLLKELKKQPVYVDLIMSQSAITTLGYESDMLLEEVYGLADDVHDIKAIDDNIASGSFETDGMIVIPCSMKTLAGIRCGYADNLLLRCADVCVKEQRPLVLVTRETPLSPIHLDNMSYLARIPRLFIMPPVMTYYHAPKTIHEMELQIVGKILGKFGIHIKNYTSWKQSG